MAEQSSLSLHIYMYIYSIVFCMCMMLGISTPLRVDLYSPLKTPQLLHSRTLNSLLGLEQIYKTHSYAQSHTRTDIHLHIHSKHLVSSLFKVELSVIRLVKEYWCVSYLYVYVYVTSINSYTYTLICM